MKKFLSILPVIVIMLTLAIPAFAADVQETPSMDIQERQNGVSFEIQDIIDYAQAYGVRGNSGITLIPIQLDIGNDVSTDLVMTIEPKSTRVNGTLNFTVSGNFYRTSDGETVTVYGLSGSFEYDGSDTEITGKSSYHRSTLKDWSGTSRTSTDKSEPYSISVLKGDYTLHYKNQENNTAWINIAVNENGGYSVGGEYVSYEVN